MSKRKQWLLYGATGYSGERIAEKAVACGYKPVLAGRDAAKVKAVAERLGLDWHTVSLDDAAGLKKLVADFPVVMHAAGPFVNTHQAMIDACLSSGTHYLDITGEIKVFEDLAVLDARARKAGIMMMPGCGFDMVPGDCLALHLKRLMPDAISMDIAVSFEGTLTRGSIKSSMANYTPDPLVRRGHKIVPLAGSKPREFDFGPGRCGGRHVANVSTFGDISVAWRTTGIPDITVYIKPAPEFAALAKLTGPDDIDRLPPGPTADELANIPTVLIGEVRNSAGEARAARMVLPQVYAITFDLAANIAQRVCDGTHRAGFQTPAGVFGEDFILEFDGCSIEPWPAAK